MPTDLSATLEAYKPEMAANYERIVRHQFAQMLKDLGPKLTGVANNWHWARTWTGLVAQVVTRTQDAVAINDARLAHRAAEYADTAVASWADKIAGKLGALESVEVKRMAGLTFCLNGTVRGLRVEIEQTVITKVSSKGLVFNQFPARIYLEGKFTSEAAFKRLAA